MTDKGKKKKVKRDIIEWAVIISIGVILYLTGLHTQVIGAIQGLILKTGILKPETDHVIDQADYDFELADQKGNILHGSTLRGQVLFINLWATWCPPCIAEMPDISRLYSEIQEEDSIKFIMITLDVDFSKAIRFIDKKGFDFDIYQFASPIPDVYSSQVIPTTYVVSPDGNIVVKKEGMAKYNSKSFKNFLRSMLQ